jgi:DNA-binding NarL/FixJ family response regulator
MQSRSAAYVIRGVNLWEQARKAGILGFVLKTNAAEDLVRAIHAALEGRVYVMDPKFWTKKELFLSGGRH